MINPLVPQRLHLQLLDLVLIQLSNWRWAWRGMVVTGIMGPTFSIIALGLFARGSDPVTLGYILTGGMVLNLMFENQDKVCSNFAYHACRWNAPLLCCTSHSAVQSGISHRAGFSAALSAFPGNYHPRGDIIFTCAAGAKSINPAGYSTGGDSIGWDRGFGWHVLLALPRKLVQSA